MSESDVIEDKSGLMSDNIMKTLPPDTLIPCLQTFGVIGNTMQFHMEFMVEQHTIPLIISFFFSMTSAFEIRG